MTAQRLPVGFIGHGSPMNVLDAQRSRPWADWGRSLPRPRTILAVSAHWEDVPLTIGRTTRHTELLYDFFGFPQPMYELEYAAPGAPDVAERIADLLTGHVQVSRDESRNLDHGAWVPLMHIFPSADVPVVEISMPMNLTESELYDLGGELSPLRNEGVFILATGNLVHDLRSMAWDGDPAPPQYVTEFDAWVTRALEQNDHAALKDWRNSAPSPLRSHPSSEHYRPIVFAAGAARGDTARFPVTGFEHGTISRRSVQLD